MQWKKAAMSRFFRFYFDPKSEQEWAASKNGRLTGTNRAAEISAKNGTRLFFKVFSAGLLLAHSANLFTCCLTPLSLPPIALLTPRISRWFCPCPSAASPGQGHPLRCPIEPGNSPTLRSTTKHKKSPSILSKKKTRGKIVLSKRERNTQCKIKKNSSFIKSSDEMAGLSTPLLRASVRRICAMISITFRPV